VLSYCLKKGRLVLVSYPERGMGMRQDWYQSHYLCSRQMMRTRFFVFVTPEGFTTVVDNEGLEKARAYLNQVPRDRRLYMTSSNVKTLLLSYLA